MPRWDAGEEVTRCQRLSGEREGASAAQNRVRLQVGLPRRGRGGARRRGRGAAGAGTKALRFGGTWPCAPAGHLVRSLCSPDPRRAGGPLEGGRRGGVAGPVAGVDASPSRGRPRGVGAVLPGWSSAARGPSPGRPARRPLAVPRAPLAEARPPRRRGERGRGLRGAPRAQLGKGRRWVGAQGSQRRSTMGVPPTPGRRAVKEKGAGWAGTWTPAGRGGRTEPAGPAFPSPAGAAGRGGLGTWVPRSPPGHFTPGSGGEVAAVQIIGLGALGVRRRLQGSFRPARWQEGGRSPRTLHRGAPRERRQPDARNGAWTLMGFGVGDGLET